MQISYRTRRHVVSAVALSLAIVGACSRDVRLTGKKLRDATAKTVTHYGQTLDENATPKQVAYVLLRAIKEDCLAETKEDREAALDIEFDVAAGDTLATANRSSRTREEFLTHIVSHWAPALCYYAEELETDWSIAEPKLKTRGPQPIPGGQTDQRAAQVLFEVNDPDGNENAGAVIGIQLFTEGKYWRVAKVGFVNNRRSLGH